MSEQQFVGLPADIERFADDMKAAGIHVGMGFPENVRCVTCGAPWPCPDSGQQESEPSDWYPPHPEEDADCGDVSDESDLLTERKP